MSRKITGLFKKCVEWLNLNPDAFTILEVFDHHRFIFLDRAALVALWSAIEQLLDPYNDKDNTTLRMALVAGDFLHASRANKRHEFVHIMELYNQRSDAAHGNMDNPQQRPRDAVISTYQLLRKLLLHAVNKRKRVQRKSLVDLVLPA